MPATLQLGDADLEPLEALVDVGGLWRQPELQRPQEVGEPPLVGRAERTEDLALVVEVRGRDASISSRPASVRVMIVPRRSAGSGLRAIRPACSSLSRRLVVPLDVSIDAFVRSVGRS